MKKIILVVLLGISLNSFSQHIDSLNVINQSSPPNIHIYGKLSHTGFSIVNIESLISDTVTIKIYFKECNGYQVISDFDTTLLYSNSWPVVPEEIQVLSILDTNTIDSTCMLITQFDTLSVFNYSNQVSSISVKVRGESINIFPNPFTDIIHIESSGVRLAVYDVLGKLQRQHSLAPNEKTSVNVSGLPMGIYVLKVYDAFGEELGSEKLVKTR